MNQISVASARLSYGLSIPMHTSAEPRPKRQTPQRMGS